MSDIKTVSGYSEILAVNVMGTGGYVGGTAAWIKEKTGYRQFFGGPVVELPDPELNLNRTGIIPQGNSDVDLNQQNTNYVFAVNINFPVNPSVCFFYEKGGSGQGIYWGIVATQVAENPDYFFRIRGGNGGVSIGAGTVYPSGTIGADIPYSSIPNSVKGTGNFGRMVVEMRPNDGGNASVKLWIDRVLIFETGNQNPAASNRLEGGAGGSLITGTSINVSGESAVDWTGENDGNGMDYYENQTANDGTPPVSNETILGRSTFEDGEADIGITRITVTGSTSSVIEANSDVIIIEGLKMASLVETGRVTLDLDRNSFDSVDISQYSKVLIRFKMGSKNVASGRGLDILVFYGSIGQNSYTKANQINNGTEFQADTDYTPHGDYEMELLKDTDVPFNEINSIAVRFEQFDNNPGEIFIDEIYFVGVT